MFLFFATPTLSHWVSVEHHVSCMELQAELQKRQIRNVFHQLGGDPYLARVRNNMVSMAYERYPDFTDFFFLDDDVGFPVESALRLIEHPADVVAGIYPKKEEPVNFPCDLELVNGKLVEVGGWYKARMVPTGFLRIKRHVLDKFRDASAEYMDQDGKGGSHKVWNIFQMGFNEQTGAWWGEDYAFCEQWARMGGEIWVDVNIPFTHRGAKKWTANFGDSVKAFEAQQKKELFDRAKELGLDVDETWDADRLKDAVEDHLLAHQEAEPATLQEAAE